MLVEHMTGRIVGEGQIVLEAAVQEKMVIGPFGGEEGRCQVIVAAQHPDLIFGFLDIQSWMILSWLRKLFICLGKVQALSTILFICLLRSVSSKKAATPIQAQDQGCDMVEHSGFEPLTSTMRM